MVDIGGKIEKNFSAAKVTVAQWHPMGHIENLRILMSPPLAIRPWQISYPTVEFSSRLLAQAHPDQAIAVKVAECLHKSSCVSACTTIDLKMQVLETMTQAVYSS